MYEKASKSVVMYMDFFDFAQMSYVSKGFTENDIRSFLELSPSDTVEVSDVTKSRGLLVDMLEQDRLRTLNPGLMINGVGYHPAILDADPKNCYPSKEAHIESTVRRRVAEIDRAIKALKECKQIISTDHDEVGYFIKL